MTDPVTEGASELDDIDWLATLDTNALQGVRLGVARTIFEREVSTERRKLFDNALEQLQEAGRSHR